MRNIKVGTLNVLNKGNFNERYKLIGESLEIKELDIFCVQEVVDEELLYKYLAPLGFNYYENSSKLLDAYGGETNSIGIFSKTPLIDNEQDYSLKEHEGHIFGRSTIIGGQYFNIFTTHSTWGANQDAKRLRQCEIIDSYAEELEKLHEGSISIYCGDFNADEDSRSIRFINGSDLNFYNNKGTFWMDAHKISGDSDNWVTNDHSTNKLGKETAVRVGITKTELLPKRRIDYIFIKGWRYGKSGFPIDFNYITHPSGRELSDHNGIYTELMIF